MNVISLFNGMGTLRQALHDMNIKVNKYYSSEIKPYAIELQQHHFPEVILFQSISHSFQLLISPTCITSGK